jgi:hypothetical protein
MFDANALAIAEQAAVVFGSGETIVVRSYPGRTQADAGALFAQEAGHAARLGYAPTAQSWGEGRPGIAHERHVRPPRRWSEPGSRERNGSPLRLKIAAELLRWTSSDPDLSTNRSDDHRLVDPKVMGSTPIGHPKTRARPLFDLQRGQSSLCALAQRAMRPVSGRLTDVRIHSNNRGRLSPRLDPKRS